MDVDRFKAVNDAFWHEAGDIVLCKIAQRLQRWESPSCAVARLGGEEFALAIVGIDGFALIRFVDGVRQELAALDHGAAIGDRAVRSEEHTSELQSLVRISYAVFCSKKKNKYTKSE